MLSRRILVVDDDPDLRSVLQERLSYCGYTVETAENGHDALTNLDQADFDGVLLDYMMPGITGMAVLQHIRQHCPLLPVVMRTGETSTQVTAQAYEAGAQACLLKPFDQETLEQVVRRWFGTAA